MKSLFGRANPPNAYICSHIMNIKQLESGFPHLSAAWLKFSGITPLSGSVQLKEQLLRNKDVRKHFPHRAILLEVLRKQYAGAGHPAALSQIELLGRENVFTVTTGHQICLLGGPSFSIYKILTTIRLAEELNKGGGAEQYVPVFWMATEDHDKAEIASVHLFGKEISWNTSQEGAVGRFSTDDLTDFLNAVADLKGTLPQAEEITALFRQCYAPGQSLANATRKWVNALFGHLGLVIIDADDPQLKALFRDQIREEIFEQPVLPIVQKVNEDLKEKGFDPQVHPREINFFYLEKQARKRIVRSEQGTFSLVDGQKKWTETEMQDEIRLHPENFSPNVLLRPLYQEQILPNIAYVGGPGELSYWIQLPQVFAYFNLPVPVMFPRNSVMLIDKGIASRFEKLGITEQDLFKSTDELVNEFIRKNAGEELDLSAYKKQLESLFGEMAGHAAKTDATLKPLVMGELQKEIKFVEALESRLKKAEKQKFDTSINQIKNTREKLFPGGSPQERVENILPHLWRYGIPLIDEIKSAMDPFDLHYHLLFPD